MFEGLMIIPSTVLDIYTYDERDTQKLKH